MVYVMIVTILAAGVWSHIKMVAAQARSAYEAAHQQAVAEIARQHAELKAAPVPADAFEEATRRDEAAGTHIPAMVSL